MRTARNRHAIICLVSSIWLNAPVVAQAPPSAAKAEAEAEIRRLKAEQTRLLQEIKSELHRLDLATPASAPQDSTRDERRAKLGQLLGEIERRIRLEDDPRTKFIASANAERAFRPYYERLTRRIEAAGTNDFARENGRSLYGSARVRMTVAADGHLEELSISSGSGTALLDEHVLSLVRQLQPFEAFTPEMRKQADRLVIDTTFRFANEP